MPLKFSTNITEIPIRYKLSIEVPVSTINFVLEETKPTIPQDAADEIHQTVVAKGIADNSTIASWKTGE